MPDGWATVPLGTASLKSHGGASATFLHAATRSSQISPVVAGINDAAGFGVAASGALAVSQLLSGTALTSDLAGIRAVLQGSDFGHDEVGHGAGTTITREIFGAHGTALVHSGGGAKSYPDEPLTHSPLILPGQ